MSEHENIRELLALAAAGALTPSEERRVAEHVRTCPHCTNQLEIWQSIAADLFRLAPPQPSSRLVETTLALAGPKLAEQAEHAWNRRVLIGVVAFAWLLMGMSWPLFQFVSGKFGTLLGLQFGHPWMGFAAFNALTWVAGAVAAVMVVVGQSRDRSVA